jgi:putative hydrolase of the HAD superfamily
MAEVLDHFDVIVESSRVALRKPDPAIYRLVCDDLGVAPEEAVFLDDLGVNLKPARAMGVTTIKVTDPDRAIADLEQVVGFPLA